MIAQLGMYDRPETAAVNDALWSGIRHELGFGPVALDRSSDFWDIWQSPDLLFSQTCGMPYRTQLYGKVHLIGTPDYGLANTAPGYYYSVIVVRRGDGADLIEYRDRTLAYNGPDSQSGWAAMQNTAQGLGFQFNNLHHSGSHIASIQAVANGQADIAAIDAVSWDMIHAYDPAAKALSVIAHSPATPGLPYITSLNQNADQLYLATKNAINTLTAPQRKTLRLQGLVRIPPKEYLAIPTPPAPTAI